MKNRYASISLILFLVSLVLLWLLTLFESMLIGMPSGAERVASAMLLVVPALTGVVFGILSLRYNEPRSWIAIMGILLNGFFALFNILVLLFAG